MKKYYFKIEIRYGVYARLTDGTAQWIADFNTQGDAEKYVTFIKSLTDGKAH